MPQPSPIPGGARKELYARRARITRAVLAGMVAPDGVLTRPFDLDTLGAAVGAALQRVRAGGSA